MTATLESLQKSQLQWEKHLVEELIKFIKIKLKNDINDKSLSIQDNNQEMLANELITIVSTFKSTLPNLVHFELSDREKIENFSEHFDYYIMPKVLHDSVGEKLGCLVNAFINCGASTPLGFYRNRGENYCYDFSRGVEYDNNMHRRQFSEEFREARKALKKELLQYLKTNPEIKKEFVINF
ncbi:hypothetical protein GLP22_13245 [Photobacterium carnosum]|uniref:hypothetical protein n=1 Tax=Photobacterium carnosum TaxID=2023717 RepID=UPI001E3C7124|nr:hypothetical protein [Photobacterium carnosum]MCD9542167.1 hypothetical protein [Photobacterium carnosum]